MARVERKTYCNGAGQFRSNYAVYGREETKGSSVSPSPVSCSDFTIASWTLTVMVHRMLDQVSPFLTPVGMDVDTSKFLVKGDRD